MMFGNTEERRMFAETVGRCLADRAPFETRQKLIDAGVDSDPATWGELCAIGATQLLFPPEDGGAAGEPDDVGLLFETAGAALSFEPFLGTLLAGRVLGGDARHGEVLGALADGSARAAVAYEEEDSYYDPLCLSAMARKRDGGWVLAGRKVAIPVGASADWLVVSARREQDPADELSLFLLSGDMFGSRLKPSRTIDGGIVSELELDGLELPAEALVGDAGRSADRLKRALSWGTFAVCAEAVGIMNVVKQQTLDYLHTRKQFGAPIGVSQVLQHRYVEMLIAIDEAESAVLSAAEALNDEATAAKAVFAAKATVGRVGTLVAEESIHMHGGIGLTRELPLAQYARRLVMIDHQFGDRMVHLQNYAMS